MSSKTKYLVVLGVADDRKARAARFDLAQDSAVRKMAGLMNFRVGVPKTEQAMALASKLPDGKLFESGLGMIPLVNEAVFYKLFEILSFDTTWTIGVILGRGHSATPELVKAADTVWSAIKVGSTVLAFWGEDKTDFAWSAAIVTAISKDGATLDLRFRDWPAKAFQAQRQAVGVLRPDVCP